VYALHTVSSDIVQITLPKPGLPPLLGTPSNVYVFLSGAPALVGTGHPVSQPALARALGTLDLHPSDIERVVALDWSPDQLGGADAFTDADILVLSGRDQSYDDLLAEERRSFLQTVALLTHDPLFAALDESALAAQADAYFTGPTDIDAIQVPTDHEVVLGSYLFLLKASPGPCPGHAVLWAESQGLLMSGRAVVERSFGRPTYRDVVAYVGSLETLHDLKPSVLLPTLGVVDRDARYALTRVHRAVTGLLGHLPFAVQSPSTLARIIWNDLGRVPSQHARLVETARTRLAALDYLVATSAIDREGEGPAAVYGALAPTGRSILG
jgi:glyoxylase-like metal-dependent hydrolase (beta-lactamase superfamily II)